MIDELIKYFISTAVITTGIVYIGKKIFDKSADFTLKKFEMELNKKYQKDERKLEELKKWTNPLLSSLNGLIGRLNNIVNEDGYKHLSNSSSEYEYYMPSTLYYLSQYLCYIQILREEINYEIFDDNKNESNFFQVLKKVNKSLRGKDNNFDRPLYSLEQREISELMMDINYNNKRVCKSYYSFHEKFETPEMREILKPLRNLFENIQKNDKKFNRLSLLLTALRELKKESENLLKK